jgi:hypothetical protein
MPTLIDASLWVDFTRTRSITVNSLDLLIATIARHCINSPAGRQAPASAGGAAAM